MMKNCSNRFSVILAAAAIALIAGTQGLRAQDQTGMFADTDGIKRPSISVAYSRIPSSTLASPNAVTSSKLAAQPLDADGIEPPDCGAAFNIDKAYKAYIERKRQSKNVAARFDGNK